MTTSFPRDANRITVLGGTSSADGITPVLPYVDPTTHRLLVDNASASGTVTSVSVVTANGVSGTVATATTTPAITLVLGAITPTTVAIGGGTALTTSNQTGTGSIVLATSPTLTSPVVGTQASTDNSTLAASTAYVTTGIANAIAAVNPAETVDVASAAKLPNSPTYNNGVAGIGAFITTLTTNTALVVDGYTPALLDRVLVKNEGDSGGLGSAKNGVFYLSQLHGVGLAWILTRALNYDQSTDINSTGAIPVENNGTANPLTSWLLTTKITTVGTDALTYTQFSYSPTTVVSPTLGGTGIANNAAMTVTGSGNFGFTRTLTGTTNVTFPTSGTLVNSAVATLSSLTSIGTIATGVWNGTVIIGTYGGTGVNNSTKTFTYLKNISFTAADDTGVYTLPTGTKTLLATDGSAASLTSFPTFNQNTTGSAASLSISGQTGLLTFTGLASTNRIKTIRDAADTILELGGSYTPTGNWTSLTMITPILGTPTSGTLTNCTGLPAASVVAGTLGSGTFTTTRLNYTNNAITASGNAATVPITSSLSTVTNNSAATLTITMTTTSAVDGQMTIVRILDSSAATQTITWVNTEDSTVTAPTTSNGSTTLFLTVGFIYNGGTSKWRTIAKA